MWKRTAMATSVNNFFYFAYGSNLLRERLVLANPSAQFTAVGRLRDYELVFVGDSGRWRGGIANIRRCEGSEMWGVVWRMDERDLPSLEKQENIYTPMDVEVRDQPGNVYLCRTFQLRLGGQWAELNPPSPHYKDVIVRGARQNCLPSSYLQHLEDVKDNGYEGKVDVYEAVIASLKESD